MQVLVIGKNGIGLMPTTPRKARVLVKNSKAVIVRKRPYTIRLLYKTGCAVQDLEMGVDTGSQNIGIGIVTEDSVLDKSEWKLRSSMDKRANIEKRKEYRKGRRYRNTPYRHPKFNFKTKRIYVEEPIKRNGHMTHWKKVKIQVTSKRESGWLPPSLQSKVDQHVGIINNHMEALPPKTELKIEIGRFDVAKIKNPDIEGVAYQRGPMYQKENVKAYVFERDGYTCKVCGKKAGTKQKNGTVVKLHAHHIDFRSKGATDNPNKMVAVCMDCHTDSAHKPGGILYKWMLQGKKFNRGYRDATAMNILRQRMWKAFPTAEFTYGNITKVDRESMHLKKSHANDAVAIACKGEGRTFIKDKCETTYYIQLRKKKRSLHEAIPRKGKEVPNRTAKRNSKNTKASAGFYLCDRVEVEGRIGWITGFTGKSAYIVDLYGNYVYPKTQSYKQVSCSKLKLISHNNNWGCQTKQ